MKPPNARVRWLTPGGAATLPAFLTHDSAAQDATLVVDATECAEPSRAALPRARELASGTRVFLLASSQRGFVARLLGRATASASLRARAGLLLARGYVLVGSSGDGDVVWGRAP